MLTVYIAAEMMYMPESFYLYVSPPESLRSNFNSDACIALNSYACGVLLNLKAPAVFINIAAKG